MKKIMILMAERTGTGHKSSANAIEKRLKDLGYDTKQIDCFKLMGKKGKIGTILENMYIPLSLKFPYVYYCVYLLSQVFTNTTHYLIYLTSKKGLKKEIEEYKPDLIISVHSLFTKAISHYLKKANLEIPYYVNVIDLVNPPNVWLDKNADMNFVPSNDVKNEYIKKGISEEKLIVSGFPIRDDIKRRNQPKIIEGKINILMVNPSVNLKKNVKYVKEVSKIKNSSITVVCGRDEKLYNALLKEQKKGNISQDIKIYGFIKNMNEILDDTHILLTKAGPNMILEGARSATAIVVTGHIQGQENNNYKYVVNNNFGFKCENPNKIYKQLQEFITSKKLQECLNNVIKSDCNNGAPIIANYIHEQLSKNC